MLIKNSIAQTPRGENGHSLSNDSGDLLGFLAIFALIAVYLAFKKSAKDGWKAIGVLGVLLFVITSFPKVGSFLIAILAISILWVIFKDMFK